MSLLVDAFLWLWLRTGAALTRVVSPEKAEELEKLRLQLLQRPGTSVQEPTEASASCSDRGNATADSSTVPRRLTSDLVQDDQDSGLCCRHASVSTAYQSVGSAHSSLDLGDGTNRPSGGGLTVPSHGSSVEDFREFQMRLEDLKATTPEMKNMLGLLLRSNEDNAVLKSALLATLAKLQAARDELQSTRAELHLTQEQAQLLAEERDFSVGRICGIPEESEEELGSSSETSAEVQRSLDTLLAALHDLRTTAGTNGGDKTPLASHVMSPARSVELHSSYSMPSDESHGRLYSSSPVSPSSDAGSVAARGGRHKPNVHLKGVGYRVALHMAVSPGSHADA